MSSVEFIAIASLILLLFLAIGIIGWLAFELFNMNKRLSRYKGISDPEAEQAKVKSITNKLQENNEKLKAEQVKLKEEGAKIRDAIAALNVQLSSLEGELDIQSYGLYEPKYDFGTSERYKIEIDNIRQRQKQMIQNKKAVICGTEWTVSGSTAKGRKMVDEEMKLLLRAFNGESDSLILKVKYDNIRKIGERIVSLYEAINKLGKTKDCWISQEYFDLKIEELHLVHEYQEKLYAEREEQRQIRERMREEEIAQRELEKAQQNAEKEEQRYQQALEQARRESEKATGEKHSKLQAEIEQLQLLLKMAQEKKERAISRAQMTKSGHVYIISNIGSFGENVYKIGMTRRLDPEDRIRELGDASVPFPFDIHAKIFSEDAPAIENQLHRAFDIKRVNRVNPRKEFFNVSLNDIKEVVLQNHSEIEFTLVAGAEEYRKTQAIFAKENGKGNSTIIHPIVDQSNSVRQPEIADLEQAVTAIKSGDKATGKQLLIEVLKADQRNEAAWLWMAQVVSTNEERIQCLQNVLKINSGNEAAKQGLAKFQQKQESQLVR